jgi:hypothetical protein
MMIFRDGIINFRNRLANIRSGTSSNRIVSEKIDNSEIKGLLVSGIGSRIVRLKAGYALNDTLDFVSKDQEFKYKKHLARSVKEAAEACIGYGRGMILLNQRGADFSRPRRGNIDLSITKPVVFSGDLCMPLNVDNDLRSWRYGKPEGFRISQAEFHHSWLIDFTYFKPAADDANLYNYGGISEFQLIRNQIINDLIIERASSTIIEKNSTVYHKMEGLKSACQQGLEADLLKYFSAIADVRSIYGDGIIDKEDDVISVSQTLSNLADVNAISLRRLSMVSGIPLSFLGDSVSGMNATGESDRMIFQDTIENFQDTCLIEPINELFAACGMQEVTFKENQGGSPLDRIKYDAIAIENAKKLFEIAGDHSKYLIEAGVTKPKEFDIFKLSDNEDDNDDY